MSMNHFLAEVAKCLRCVLALPIILVALNTPANAQLWPPPDHTPLIDGNDTIGGIGGLYKGQFYGFLYGHWNDGTNIEDTKHITDGVNAANNVVPLCPNGMPSGCSADRMKIVVLMIGMSNWTKEACDNQPPNNVQVPPLPLGQTPDPLCSNGARNWSFIYKATSNPQVNNSKLVFVDCASIGAVAGFWVDDTRTLPNRTTGAYTNCNTNILANWPADRGGPLTRNQV